MLVARVYLNKRLNIFQLLRQITWTILISLMFCTQISAFQWDKIMGIFKEFNFNGTVPNPGHQGMADMFTKIQSVLKEDPDLWNWMTLKAQELRNKNLSPFDAGFDLWKDYKEFMRQRRAKAEITTSRMEAKMNERQYYATRGPGPNVFYMHQQPQMDNNGSQKYERKEDVKVDMKVHMYNNGYQTKFENTITEPSEAKGYHPTETNTVAYSNNYHSTGSYGFQEYTQKASRGQGYGSRTADEMLGRESHQYDWQINGGRTQGATDERSYSQPQGATGYQNYGHADGGQTQSQTGQQHDGQAHESQTQTATGYQNYGQADAGQTQSPAGHQHDRQIYESQTQTATGYQNHGKADGGQTGQQRDGQTHDSQTQMAPHYQNHGQAGAGQTQTGHQHDRQTYESQTQTAAGYQNYGQIDGAQNQGSAGNQYNWQTNAGQTQGATGYQNNGQMSGGQTPSATGHQSYGQTNGGQTHPPTGYKYYRPGVDQPHEYTGQGYQNERFDYQNRYPGPNQEPLNGQGRGPSGYTGEGPHYENRKTNEFRNNDNFKNQNYYSNNYYQPNTDHNQNIEKPDQRQTENYNKRHQVNEYYDHHYPPHHHQHHRHHNNLYPEYGDYNENKYNNIKKNMTKEEHINITTSAPHTTRKPLISRLWDFVKDVFT